MAVTETGELTARRQQSEQLWQEKTGADVYITVGMGTCGISAGARSTLASIEAELEKRQMSAVIGQVGCVGMCSYEPMIELQTSGTPRMNYGQAVSKNIPEIFASYFDGAPLRKSTLVGEVRETVTRQNGHQLQSLSFVEPGQERKIPFQAKQVRVVLSNCGLIDPESFDDYLALDGYVALELVLSSLSPEDVIEVILNSGLRGRGGGGFPTGLKWRFARQTQKWPKHVICNADEGDPGAFMDRSVLEGDPHSVIEGMIIAGYAIGAQYGYIYCRAEYPLAISRLEIALGQARELGLLGGNILDSGFSFDISIKEGAGAFVCGEETALMSSIQGERGQPWPRPPYPAVSGVWNQPTNVNNVKSYAYTPRIIRLGPDWFRSLGTEKSPGTAVFALTGMVNRTGLIEVPMGITLREIIYDIGGGIAMGRKFKAVQTGGPLGGCLPEEHLDTPVDFDSLRTAGSVMGSGGMIVADETTCMVEFAKYFMQFVCDESCGKCPPCRIGSTRMLEMLERITAGNGKLEDLDEIRRYARGMQKGSLCALGQLAPSPVLAALRHFEDEFIAHIVEKRCPAGACHELVRARCSNSCPAHVDVPSYVALVAQGRYAEALEVHRRQNPFALACGRVCPAFCEDSCRRGDIDEPIAIRGVKRFMADHERSKPWVPPIHGAAKQKKVAVVGAGPAGLTAALRLAQEGYSVTVFEKLPVAGGMMAVGIPGYRLPRDILNEEIDSIRRAGVDIRCGHALGRDFALNDLLDDQGYGAVILAVGAHKSNELRVEGEKKVGVVHGTDFLRDVALGNTPDLTGKRVGVVGGGNMAIDAARTAWRLGASEVHVIYRRRRQDMPAYEEEIAAAEDEGGYFHFLTNPTYILGDGHVTGVECLRQTLGDFDSSGRRRPIPIANSEFVIDLDVLIPAIGQAPDQSWMTADEGIALRRTDTIEVSKTLCTTQPGVFAAGDVVLGPGTVIAAVAQGDLVARAVHYYLTTGQTDQLITTPGYEVVDQPFNLNDYADAVRAERPVLPVEERHGNFCEVELGMDKRTIQEECKRCLRCDLEWLETTDKDFEPVPTRESVVA